MSTVKERLEMRLHGERGATAVIVAVLVVLLFGVGAISVDLWHLFVARGELQNAADACALAGARALYDDEGTTIVEGANEAGRDAGVTNVSQKTAVEINWTSGNTGDVQRGHWNFDAHGSVPAGTFTPNSSTAVIDLWNISDEELDDPAPCQSDPSDTCFINAVKCVTRREATPVTNFLAPVLGIFGGDFLTTIVRAEAVAVRGFEGTIEPGEVDLPVALCGEKLRNADGEYSCSVGRMLNDGNTEGTSETAMWTDFNQSGGCSAASANEVRPLVCSGGNPGEIFSGSNVDSTNGVAASTFDTLLDCWKTGLHLDTNGDEFPDADLDTDGDGWPDVPWQVDLPVVTCGNNDPCTPLSGAVTVNIVAVVRSANLSGANLYDEVLTKMGAIGDGSLYPAWQCSSLTGGACADNALYPTDGEKRRCCWGEFVNNYNLKNSDGQDAPYASKSIYFVPDCAPHDPSGRTGGENYGIIAKYPALVQ